MSEELNYKKLFDRPAINLDITHRCPLECQNCQRFTSFTSKGIKVPGKDLAVDDFAKIIKHFNHINFCGQVSDPVHHPKFIKLLEMCYENGNSVSVHHASGAKARGWYPKAFKANPKARWTFGIDGLPEESDFYRRNQDGEKLYEMMIIARDILIQKPVWQWIVFSYNENHIAEGMQMAADIDVRFMTLLSSRWNGPKDPLKPKNDKLSLDLYNWTKKDGK